MTLDGKIATQQGHSAWVTSPPARALVFDARARSDAVIVGGNTVSGVQVYIRAGCSSHTIAGDKCINMTAQQ
jgi:hypothetical protein